MFLHPQSLKVLGGYVMENPGKTNLMSWWMLNETSGTRYDSYGGKHLSDINTVGYRTGKKSNAASFIPGNSECLSVADSTSFTNLSIGGWFYLDVLTDQALLQKDSVSNLSVRSWALHNFSSVVSFYVFSPSGYNNINVAVSAGQWNFYVAVHDAANQKLRISINGGEFSEMTHTHGIGSTSSPIMIGARDHSTSRKYMDGAADEVFIYKKVLNMDHVRWLYNHGTGRTYSEL